MKEKTKNMTSGEPLRLILAFALPMMVANVFQQMYTVVDTMVVGRVLGVDDLAAVGATDRLYGMLLAMITGVTNSVGILMAREFGAKQYETLRRVVGNAVTLSCIFAGLIMVIGLSAARPVLVLMETPPEILERSMSYLRLLLVGIPVSAGYNLTAAILRSMGDSKTPLNAMIVASLSNVALAVLFVMVLGFGIEGIALAILIAQGISCVYCLVQLRKVEILSLRWNHFALAPVLVKRHLALGTPMMLQSFVISIGGMLLASVVNSFGVTFIGGYTSANKLRGVLEIAATSFDFAMITYVGQNLGAGNFDRIRTGMRRATATTVAISCVIGCGMLLFGRQIIGLFLSGDPQEVAAATEVAVRYLSLMSFFMPVLYVLHISRSAVQGMGNTVLPMMAGFGELIVRVFGVLLLPKAMGGDGIFLAEVLAWTGGALIVVPSYFVTFKKVRGKIG